MKKISSFLLSSIIVFSSLSLTPSRAYTQLNSDSSNLNFNGSLTAIASHFSLSQDQTTSLSRLLRDQSFRGPALNLQSVPPSNQFAQIPLFLKNIALSSFHTSGSALQDTSSDADNKLRSELQQLQDISSLSQIIPGIEASQIQKSEKALETVLRYRQFFREQRLKNDAPNFDGAGQHAPSNLTAKGDAVVEAGVAAVAKVHPTASLTAPRPTHGGSQRDEASASQGGSPIASESFRGPKPMGKANEIQSDLETLSDAAEHSISHSYPGHIGKDPAQLVIDYIDDYIAFKGMSNSEKHLVVQFYEVGDMRVIAAMERAVKADIKITFITDINQCMVGKFNGEKHNTDFEHAEFKTNPPGKALQYLHDKLGFTFNEGKFTILSGVPLYDPADKTEKPLMHEKGVYALGPNGQAYGKALIITSNMNATEEKSAGPLPSFGGRFNRMWVIKDPKATQVLWKHALAERETFLKRTGPKVTNIDPTPDAIVYRDGTRMEIAFTYGIQNPNDRKTDLLQRAADPANEIEMVGMFDFQFVKTKTDEIEALRRLMAVQTDFRVRGAFDQQFIWLDGYGLAGALANFLVARPHGKPVFPFSTELESRMDLLGYQRLLDSAQKIDLDAAPTLVHLLHDKTAGIKTREKLERTGQKIPRTRVFSGSLNDSNHFESLESQIMFEFSSDAPLAKEVEEGTWAVFEAESDFAIQLAKAITRDWLAGFTGHTPYDINVKKYVESFIVAVGKQDYNLASSLIGEIAGLSNRILRTKTSPQTISEHLKKLIFFLNWYAKEIHQDSSLHPMTFKKVVEIGIGFIHENEPIKMKLALDILYYNPHRNAAETLALEKKAWTEGLEMSEPFPEPSEDNSHSRTHTNNFGENGVNSDASSKEPVGN